MTLTGLNLEAATRTVAAWQAWVETYVNTALATMTEPAASHSDDTEYLRLLDASRPLIELCGPGGGSLQHARRGRGLPAAAASWR